MHTQERGETIMERRTDRDSRTAGSPTSGWGGGVLVGLVALACPLLCLGPVLLVGLASTGLLGVLRGAPWPLIVGAMLAVVVLGVWGTRARQARQAGDCCAPLPRAGTLREVHDESAR
jgi:hypothetical protein